jgi:hypothetical protein
MFVVAAVLAARIGAARGGGAECRARQRGRTARGWRTCLRSPLEVPRGAMIGSHDTRIRTHIGVRRRLRRGGGRRRPSGATAAHDLAPQGRRVLLLDRAGRIKPCGGAIPPR